MQQSTADDPSWTLVSNHPKHKKPAERLLRTIDKTYTEFTHTKNKNRALIANCLLNFVRDPHCDHTVITSITLKLAKINYMFKTGYKMFWLRDLVNPSSLFTALNKHKDHFTIHEVLDLLWALSKTRFDDPFIISL